jgi:hypothetical protein
MNLFGSKKEAWVMAVVAAFFVLVALVFTFEPLITVILSTRTMPAATTASMTIAPALHPKADFFDALMATVPPSHGWAGNVALLNKIKSLVLSQKIVSATTQTNSAVLEDIAQPEQLATNIRRFLSKLTPFEIKTILPDQTSMIETVIDPSLIVVKTDSSQKPSIWTFAQTSPQLVIKKNGQNSSIFINYPQVVYIHGFESITGCSVGSTGIKTIAFNTVRKALISSMFSSFSAYFRDYSCFQSFSTLFRKS